MSLKNMKMDKSFIHKLEDITKNIRKLQISKQPLLSNIFENIQNSEKSIYYLKNTSNHGSVNSNNSHENLVKKVLIDNGFIESNEINIKRNQLDDKINKPEEISLKSGEFIEQPFGTQNNPDFLVKLNKKSVIAIECKSSKGGKPQYNSGGITSYFIYIFSSKSNKSSDTTFYMGSSIQSFEIDDEIKKHILKLKEMDILINQKLKELDVKNRGIGFYSRPMIVQNGNRSKTNYFEHEDRKSCENEVIKFLKDQENLIHNKSNILKVSTNSEKKEILVSNFFNKPRHSPRLKEILSLKNDSDFEYHINYFRSRLTKKSDIE